MIRSIQGRECVQVGAGFLRLSERVCALVCRGWCKGWCNFDQANSCHPGSVVALINAAALAVGERSSITVILISDGGGRIGTDGREGTDGMDGLLTAGPG